MTLNDNLSAVFGYQGYYPVDQALKSSATTTVYFSFINKQAQWFIMERNTAAGANSLITTRFYRGSTDYDTAWAARETFTFGKYNAIFV